MAPSCPGQDEMKELGWQTWSSWLGSALCQLSAVLSLGFPACKMGSIKHTSFTWYVRTKT